MESRAARTRPSEGGEVPDSKAILNGRLLVVAFEGWNDAGDAASGAVGMLKDLLDLSPIAEVDAEDGTSTSSSTVPRLPPTRTGAGC